MISGAASSPAVGGEQVGLQAGADDQPGQLLRRRPGCRPPRRPPRAAHAGHRGAGQHLPACGLDVAGEGAGDRGVVDDRGGRREQRGLPGDLRLQLARMATASSHARRARRWRPPAARSPAASPSRRRPGRPPASRARPRAGPGPRSRREQFDAAPAQRAPWPSPAGSRSRVHDPGVVPGLVLGDGRLLLEDHHGHAGARELPGYGQPDDACPDDPDRRGVADARYHWYLTAVVLILV